MVARGQVGVDQCAGDPTAAPRRRPPVARSIAWPTAVSAYVGGALAEATMAGITAFMVLSILRRAGPVAARR